MRESEFIDFFETIKSDSIKMKKYEILKKSRLYMLLKDIYDEINNDEGMESDGMESEF